MSESQSELHQTGDAHYAAGRFDQALLSFRAALALDPSSLSLHFNVGNALRHLGRPRDAIAAYDAALALSPNFAMARHNRATCLLQIGDLAEGFREYEWRKACAGFVEDPRYALPRPWRGEDLQGKTVYIYPELFLGDVIQFVRYAVLVESLGARVILGAPTATHALLRTLSPTIILVADDAPAPDYDFQSALLTLPAIFGTTLETVPNPPCYLGYDRDRTQRWRERIGSDGLKIGIAWQGSQRAANRAFPLALAADRLLSVPGVRLVSLQKHDGLDQLQALPPGRVLDLGADFDPGPDIFLDTAAAMAACDLFITLDTSVAHVAGAIGMPTWLVLPTVTDWRWLQDRSDSPWYPSLRLFRQATLGDWAPVFDDLARRLRAIPRA